MPEFKLKGMSALYTDGAFSRLQTAAQAALECLVWTEQPDGEDWSHLPIHREVAYSIMTDIAAFMAFPEVQKVCEDNIVDPAYIGHNFYLSANHHGAGFWDTPLPRGGQDILHKMTGGFERYLYMDDDGFIRSE